VCYCQTSIHTTHPVQPTDCVCRYAVEHIARAVRVLRQEGGHLLCVGVGGSGRQSLSRLAGFIAGMEVFQVGCCCASCINRSARSALFICLHVCAFYFIPRILLYCHCMYVLISCMFITTVMFVKSLSPLHVCSNFSCTFVPCVTYHSVLTG